MKKIILPIFTSFIFIWIIYYMIFPVYFGISNPLEYWKISKLPNFTFYQIENDTVPFYPSDLNENQKLVVVFFHTNCDYCQNELEMISLNLDEFDDVQFLFVSEQRSYAIKGYLQAISLYGRENVFVARSNNFEFIKKFGHKPIPTTYIYTEKRMLRKRRIGQQTIENLVAWTD
ncbi:MAG: redoxin domain-containing protein [Bacteroidales bacterium]|nr:redoxin domain-containing protein [Bacteroidales bacterium]